MKQPIPTPSNPFHTPTPCHPLHAAVSYIIFDITIKCHKTVINQCIDTLFRIFSSYINLEIANV